MLEAASADGTPEAPPPFFLPRLHARLDAARPHPVGLAAVRVLFAMLLLASGLSAWAVKEGSDVAREREAAIARAAGQGTAPADIVLAALLSESAEAPR